MLAAAPVVTHRVLLTCFLAGCSKPGQQLMHLMIIGAAWAQDVADFTGSSAC